MFESKVVNTVGELRELLKQFPDEKPIIYNDGEDTLIVEVYNWADSSNEDCEWPLAIRGV